ncbi:ABC transporter permease [Halalkalibacillus halophilus]|uniref:ABC transporter permease n=1 Tax=Halalkalibacillus halophilus TaxID=392827 RepID=UPI0003F6A654|nr:ABC transporter permease [Halalkalibacillus halophilus]
MIFHLIHYEWKRIIQKPLLFIFTLLFPLALIGMIGFVIYLSLGDEITNINITVNDEDQTFETEMLISQLESDETLQNHLTFKRDHHQSVESLKAEEEQNAAIVHIPENFTEQLRSGNNESIIVHLNQQLPFQSQLTYVLLASGETYITAAQSGVNTVNHYLSDLLASDQDRSNWIQQLTVHYTFLALSRNDLFQSTSNHETNNLSWNQQLYLAIVMILLLSSISLYAFLFKTNELKEQKNRLHTIGVTDRVQLVSKLVHVSLVACLFLFFYAFIIPFAFPFNVPIQVGLVISWMFVALWIAGLLVLCEYFVKVSAMSTLLFGSIGFITCLLMGMIIPPMYLPETLRSEWVPFDLFYAQFVSVIVGESIAWDRLGGMVLMVVVMVLIPFLFTRGKSHV